MAPLDAEMRGMDNYTVALWVKVAKVTGGGTETTFFTTRFGGNANHDPYQCMLRIVDKKLRYMHSGTSNNQWSSNTFDSSLEVPPNQWFHVAATVTASGIKLYVNGQPAGSWTKAGLKFCPPDRKLGQMSFGIGDFYLAESPGGKFAG